MPSTPRTVVTTKTPTMSTTQTEVGRKRQKGTEADEQLTYQCPYCEEEYTNEILARVHVTRSQDSGHLNKNGMMPETEIQVVNQDGNVVDTLSKRPDQLDTGSLTLNDIADEYSDQHKCIIIAGAENQYEEEYRELEKAAQDKFEEHGLEELSYSTIRRVLRNFYRPQEVEAEKQEKEENTDEEELLGDLRTKQQAIVIAHLANPDEGKSKIADRGAAANSYPRQVYERAEDIISRLNGEIESGTSVREAVLAELDADDIKKLYEQSKEAYEAGDITLDEDEDVDEDLFDLGFNLRSELKEEDKEEVFDMGVGEQKQAMSASPYETETTTEEPTEEPAETWGAAETEESDATAGLDEVAEPVEEVHPETAEAEEPTVEETEPEPTTAEPEDEPEVEAEPEAEAEEPVVEEPAEGLEEVVEDVEAVSGEGVPRDKIDDLREKVAFFVEVTENEAESQAQSRQLAFAQKVENELEEILEAH